MHFLRNKKAEKKREGEAKMWLCSGRHYSVLCRNVASFSIHFSCSITSSTASAQGKKIVSDEAKNFSEWLWSRGEKEACESATMGISRHGRGLFAIKPIKAGDYILKISKHLIITPDRLDNEAKGLLHTNVSSCTQLALLILAEQYAGQESEWVPYMKCLPQIGSLNNTVLWSDKELGMLQCSSRSYRQSLQSRSTILEEFAAVNHVFQQCPHIFSENVTCTSFQHAYAVVNSRAWGIDEVNTVGLLPFVDFLNHDALCKSFLSFNQENDKAEVVADRDYAPGEEILVNYGRFGNGVMAETFGFTIEDNPYDEVEIWMGLSNKDILHKEKLQLLCAHGMLSLNGTGNSGSEV